MSTVSIFAILAGAASLILCAAYGLVKLVVWTYSRINGQNAAQRAGVFRTLAYTISIVLLAACLVIGMELSGKPILQFTVGGLYYCYCEAKLWFAYRWHPTFLGYANAMLDNYLIACDCRQTEDFELLIDLRCGKQLPHTTCSSVESFATYLESKLDSYERESLLKKISAANIQNSQLLCDAYELVVKKTLPDFKCPYKTRVDNSQNSGRFNPGDAQAGMSCAQ